MPSRTRMLTVFGVLAAIAAVCLAQVSDITGNECDEDKASSATDAKDGNYAKVCVDKAQFEDQEHAFNFKSSYIRDTTFTDVSFFDDSSEEVNFDFAFWETVVFENCEFDGADIAFREALLTNVKFVNCVFTSRAIFEQITMINVVFEDCTFEAGALFTNAEITDMTIDSSKIEGEETLIDQATVKAMTITGSDIGAIRWQLLDANAITIDDCRIEEFNCHEPLKEGEFVSARAEFNNTIITNTKIESVSCDQTIFRDLDVEAVELGEGQQDFAASNFTNANFRDVSNIGDGDCAEMDMSESRFSDGGSMEITELCKLDMSNTTIDGMDLTGVDMENDDYDFDEARFKDERILEDECCVEVCKGVGCLCDIPVEPTTGCPKGNKKVNPNIEGSGACFPADATVQLRSGETKMMRDLEIGDTVLVGKDIYSDVFMFTHRLPEGEHDFVRLSTHSGLSIRLSPGHFLYLDGSLVAAKDAAVGNIITLADGTSEAISAVSADSALGLYNPQTLHGDIVVDGVIASTYTQALEPSVAHAALAPTRALYSVLGISLKCFDKGVIV